MACSRRQICDLHYRSKGSYQSRSVSCAMRIASRENHRSENVWHKLGLIRCAKSRSDEQLHLKRSIYSSHHDSVKEKIAILNNGITVTLYGRLVYALL